MANTREEVVEAAKRLFAEADLPLVLAMLDDYGVEPHERERERAQLAMVHLAAGDRDALAKLVAIAKQDYRDVLHWEHQGPLSAEEGARWRAAAQKLLQRWGNRR